MSVWILFLIGIIIGWIIGVVIARQNYEACREHVERLKQELLQLETEG